MSSAAAALPERFKLVVVEREAWWLPELERQFPGQRARAATLEEVARLGGDLDPEGVPRVIVIEAELLRDCFWTSRRPPLWRSTVAILSDGDISGEWLLRELGIAAVVQVYDGGRRLAQAIQHLATSCFQMPGSGISL